MCFGGGGGGGKNKGGGKGKDKGKNKGGKFKNAQRTIASYNTAPKTGMAMPSYVLDAYGVVAERRQKNVQAANKPKPKPKPKGGGGNNTPTGAFGQLAQTPAQVSGIIANNQANPPVRVDSSAPTLSPSPITAPQPVAPTAPPAPTLTPLAPEWMDEWLGAQKRKHTSFGSSFLNPQLAKGAGSGMVYG